MYQNHGTYLVEARGILSFIKLRHDCSPYLLTPKRKKIMQKHEP